MNLTDALDNIQDATVLWEQWCVEEDKLDHSDVDAYLRAQRYVKPAWVPRRFAGRSDAPCPITPCP